MSASPPPQPLPQPTTPPAPEANAPTNEDPAIAPLRAMFPDYDDLILQSVLQSSGGNQDRAIDTLLGMSDPEYRSEHPQPANDNVNNPAPVLTQEELDEQFARQLALSEQQQQQEQWLAANQGQPQVNYTTRPGRGWAPPQQPQAQQGQPSEFQEQFAKIAETGKKTFGSLLSKVKAKIQEFETGRPAAPGSSEQQQYQQQQQNPPTAQPQASYYDPNPPSNSIATNPAPPRSLQSQSPPATGVQGYDMTTPPARTSTSPQPVEPLTVQRQPSPITTPSPPATMQGAPQPIDAGKLGLLPKRPVSLLRDPNPGAGSPPSGSGSGSTGVAASTNNGKAPATSHNDNYSDDDLEYAENPFEDSTGKK
ncbi:hypothetical protein D9613_000306 [Agrocybe pediades]|uniref:CUE domain-containing protein n=1 Tax=Agrocybe pediades TaxID=84607 RepID=A0A8H4R297_9AGAR|nr:hypothetical protein D9613_000306 [Agrocybe pediades]